MANISLKGSASGTALMTMLNADDIEPGSSASYELAKQIYLYHPMGKKLVEAPTTVAQWKRRKISVPSSPEAICVDEFNKRWDELNADKLIANTMHLARTYGIASVIYGAQDIPTDEAIEPTELYKQNLYFNCYDPLNTAGSLVLNQDPNAPDFQKAVSIRVQGKVYHKSRVCIMMNESPVYISFSTSAFGFVWRSVYQRSLFPLKSYVQTMITNDLVVTKAGVIIAKVKQAGAIVDNFMAKITGRKRDLLKEASQGSVISIDPDEDIDTLDLNNTDKALGAARSNIIEDIASSDDMPPKLLLANGYASVLANGTEDFKSTMQYISSHQTKMKPLYDFFDEIVMHVAWNPEFYQTIQARFPNEYGQMSYNQAFYQWKNDFAAVWPSLQDEPESDKADAEKVKLDAIIAVVEKMGALLDPENMARLMEWAADNINENKVMFTNPLDLDITTLLDFLQTQKEAADQAALMAAQNPMQGKPE